VSALLFIVLALQTGLTGLDPEKRFVRLCRNFCLLFTVVLHYFHNIVNPLLIWLSASHSSSLHLHARALIASAFLVIFPTSLLIYLWSHQQVNHWLLAVSAFSIQVSYRLARHRLAARPEPDRCGSSRKKISVRNAAEGGVGWGLL